ncbi:leucine-rich repeat-containing protein 4C-like [Tetranychus urticae]|uniref:leucine-rich repeat-containing protein 4C-like n=2 Tax=Tetranychus urticae TaxID=32264 RepID=UPI000D658A54|nr:leucine-rich repeat-containing protein 4C-like [Tetranychus urticae]
MRQFELYLIFYIAFNIFNAYLADDDDDIETELVLESYVDADWGGNFEDKRSATGYSFYLNGDLISWNTKKQQTIALSTTEAEYMAETEAIKEAIWLKSLMNELGYEVETPIDINCDNQVYFENHSYNQKLTTTLLFYPLILFFPSFSSSSCFFLFHFNLQRLQLHENRITSIDVNTFKGFSASDSLDALNLASNNIKEIPEKSFQSLSSLNSLALEKNRISAIHPFAFQGIEDSLEWLTLGDNILNSIPSYALQNLTRLRQLDLRGNNITIVEENSFKDFGGNLKFLYLKNNRIKIIETGAFDKLISLEWLYLDSNQLIKLSHETFYPIIDSLKVLDLHDNPFVCHCGLVWFSEWVRDEGKSIVNMPDKTECQLAPDSPKKLPIREMQSSLLDCVSLAIQQKPEKTIYFILFNIAHFFLVRYLNL